MIKNTRFVSTARIAGQDYPAHDALEQYAVTLCDLDACRQRERRSASSPTSQANRTRYVDQLRILEAREKELRARAEALIGKCETPDEREMLRMRYLLIMDWTTIARVLYSDEPDFFNGKEYRHRALCLHQAAMRHLEGTLKNEDGME